MLYETHLNVQALSQIAGSTGADIAFFITDGAKRAQGIGDILESVDYSLLYPLVIVKPFGGVNTASAFRLFHQTNAPQAADVQKCIATLSQNDVISFAASSKNMLQTAGIKLCPQIEEAISALYQNGALFAQMTGSGSAVYGIFPNAYAAQTSAERIAQTEKYEFALPVCYSAKVFEPILTIDTDG